MRLTLISSALLLALRLPAQAQEKWDRDIGKLAPRLIAGGGVGTPVSLDALRRSDATPAESSDGETVTKKAEISGGTTVVLTLWNSDTPG